VSQGRHEYDGKFPDWTEAGLQQWNRRLHQLRDSALAFPIAPSDSAARFERNYLVSEIDRDLFWSERADWPHRNPEFYTGNIDPKRDVMILEGPMDDLDHAALRHRFGGKLGIDATVPFAEKARFARCEFKPMELDDAARIDGCGYARTLWQVLLPLCKSPLVAVGVFSFVGHWSDFFGPLIYLNAPENFTMVLGTTIAVMSLGDAYFNLGYIMAMVVMTVIPILLIYFWAQRYFIEGITLTGVK